MKKRVSKKVTKNDEDMSVFDLSLLMMKQFDRIDKRFEKNEEDHRLLSVKVSRIAEEQEKMAQEQKSMSEKLDQVNAKANNTFFLAQEVRKLDERVTNLEK